MTVHTLPLGIYQANCYIVVNADRCIAIDPGGNPEKVLQFLEENGLTLDAVLLTHGHFDHVGGAEALVRATCCALWMQQADCTVDPAHKRLFPLSCGDVPEVQFLEDGQLLHPAGLDVSILETPGHTYGSVCIFMEDCIFSGDTLFSGSIGRTDLAGGDRCAMQESLLRLKALERNYTVYPGHGPATTLEREKRVNPFLR